MSARCPECRGERGRHKLSCGARMHLAMLDRGAVSSHFGPLDLLDEYRTLVRSLALRAARAHA